MQRHTLLKLFGLAILAQIILVALSFVEVIVYSYVVNPGQRVLVYENHAQQSAPWVSGVCGCILFFFVSRYWTKKKLANASRIAVLFPAAYSAWDLTVLLLIGVSDWVAFVPIFLLANGAKFLGSLGGYYFHKDKQTPQ